MRALRRQIKPLPAGSCLRAVVCGLREQARSPKGPVTVSPYKYVSYNKRTGLWQATYAQKYLGQRPTAKAAALLVCKAAKCKLQDLRKPAPKGHASSAGSAGSEVGPDSLGINYTGVSWDRQNRKFRARWRGKFLGLFVDKQAAAAAVAAVSKRPLKKGQANAQGGKRGKVTLQLRRFIAIMAICQHRLPGDLEEAVREFPRRQLQWHPGFHLVVLLWKYGPARAALEKAAGSAGSAGHPGGGSRWTPAALHSVLCRAVPALQGKAFAVWTANCSTRGTGWLAWCLSVGFLRKLGSAGSRATRQRKFKLGALQPDSQPEQHLVGFLGSQVS